MFFSTKKPLKIQLHHALYLVWKSGPCWTIISVVILLIQSIFPLLTLYLMKLVIDTLTVGLANPDMEVAFGRVLLLIFLAGLTALAKTLCNSISGLVGEAQAQVINDRMHIVLHTKSINVDLEYYENSKYYDTLHHAQHQAFRINRILKSLMQVGQNGISLFVMAGLLFSFHWTVALLIFAAALPQVFVSFKYADKMYDWQRKQTPKERQAQYFHWMITGDQHAKEIRMFNLGSIFISRFQEIRAQLRRERLKIFTKRSTSELFANTTAVFALFGSYAFIAYRMVQGSITLGDLVMYYQAFQRGQAFFQGMLNGLAGLYEDNLFLSTIYEFLDLKRKVVEPINNQLVPQPMQTGIMFNNVGFQYPSGANKVLDNINLSIRPGKVVALVGENGSGKTTLIKLLCRLYDPTYGNITIDGIDIRQFKTLALRGEISVIFQDYAKYNLTARENIWFGNLDLAKNDERVFTAARQSGADDIITELPRGYETILGKWFEDGEELSIGEWQKVALARAFLRNTQIIVLDEPTSSLDPKAEYEVFKKFRRLVTGRTVIIISHRFSTVRLADYIYVLEGGRIVESGTHDELTKQGGRYSNMFETQAQYYHEKLHC